MRNTGLRDIVLDDFNKSILKNIKTKTKAKSNFRVFLCDRYSVRGKDIEFCELNEKGDFVKTVQDVHILKYITTCYLNNVPIRDGGNRYYSPVYSKVGCLGVVLFETSTPSESLVITNPIELYVKKSMSALGQGILSNLCLIKDTPDKYDSTITSKISYVYEYFPFGEIRDCVCMFVNIKDFVSVQSKLGKPELFIRLREFSEKVTSIANSRYGIVNCVFGGSALIVFNVLLFESVEIACRRAVCAAIKIREETKDIFQIDAYVGIGSNAGSAFFFDFENSCLSNYTCFGEIVSNTKKIEHISGKKVGHTNGQSLATESEHIMLSKSIYSNLSDEDLKKGFRGDMIIPRSLYSDSLYGIPITAKMTSCSNCLRRCRGCPETNREEG